MWGLLWELMRGCFFEGDAGCGGVQARGVGGAIVCVATSYGMPLWMPEHTNACDTTIWCPTKTHAQTRT